MLRSYLRLHILLVLCIGLPCLVVAQDVENMGQKAKDKLDNALKNPIQFSGGVNAQMTSYSAFGMMPNRDPFLWQVGLNLNVKLFDLIDIPFSATISSQQFDATLPAVPQPFNNFGASPKYKAFTAHLGYRTLNLSEFSLNGSQFLGVGLEVKPENSFVSGKVLWGRFAEPVLFNPNGTLATTPTYARTGWGAGITLGKKPENQVTLNLFNAQDIPESLDTDISGLTTRPSDNFVFGVTTKQKITKKINAEGEIDFSMLTEDVTVEETILDGYSFINNIFLLQTNATTTMRKAISLKVNYKPSFTKLQFKYRRVDPGYRTLGTSFINNDYEDVSVNNTVQFFKKKVNMSVLGGLQRNNLNNTKITDMVRVIVGANASWKMNDKWNMGVNYSNFNSTTRQAVITTIDSLFFAQVTRSAGFTLTRNKSGEKKTGAFMVALNGQDLIVNGAKTTQFYNANLGYNIQWVQSKTSLGFSAVAVHSITEDLINSNLGPSVRFGKSFFKDKVQTNVIASYLPSFVDFALTGQIMNISISGNYAVTKAHKIGFNIGSISKQNTGAATTSEITAMVNYNYAF